MFAINRLTIPKITKLLLSFESLFFLLINAGRFKGISFFLNLPVDISIILLGINIFVALFVFIKKPPIFSKESLILLLIFLLFISFILLSFFWTPSHVYAHKKLLSFFCYGVWGYFAAAMIVSQSRLRCERYWQVVIFYSTIYAVIALFDFTLSVVNHASFFKVLGGNYLGVSRVLGLAAIVALTSAFNNNGVSKWKHSRIAVSILFVFLMLVDGARGPLLAFLLVMFLFFLYRVIYIGVNKKNLLIFTFLLIIGLLLLFVFFVPNISSIHTLSRLSVIFTEVGGGTSASTRITLFMQAINIFNMHPLLGGGFGSFPVLCHLQDVIAYPHNIVLELLAELGIIGFGLMVLLVFFTLKFFYERNIKTDNNFLIIILMFVFALVNSLISGDIVDNGLLFTSLGFMFYTSRKSINR